jgi:hypothetical protein
MVMVRIERKFHFQRHGNQSEIVAGEAPSDPPVPIGRVPRVAKLLALAIRFEGLLQRGEVEDYATLARLGHVTRARMTQIMNLTLLTWPEYLEKGAIFWPDYSCWQLKRDVWEIFDIPEVAARWQSEVAFESGQYLINKTRCWSELRMALWYAEHSDFVFRVVYGDKECFHLGWRKLGSDYAMPSKAPGWNQHTIVQWDFRDQQMFNHRCQDKWKLGGGNRRNNSLANEELCFNFVADLRKRWDGVLWHNLDPTPAEHRVISELIGRRFLYRRVGHDERPMLLEPLGRVGEGAAECERRWDINIDDGATILTLSRLDRPTCHLQRNGDGVWKGQWLEHERMPIEFIPLEK